MNGLYVVSAYFSNILVCLKRCIAASYTLDKLSTLASNLLMLDMATRYDGVFT